MSEDWGADHIPRPRGTRPSGSNLVEALSAAQHMPLDALEDAILRPDAIAETVLAAVAQAATGTSLTPRERNLVFWGMHVLGQARETRLSGPLLAWLRRPFDELAETFGEIVETTLPKIVVGTFDGDADRLEAALADREADEVIRWSLFAAYAYLVFAGRIGRGRAHAFLIRFDEERPARAGDAAWAGWEEAIALLGLRELAPRRAAAVADARLLPADEADDGFEAMLALAETEPADGERFAQHGVGYLDDAIGDLDEALASDEEADATEPLQNPLRHVGRNDPCPCGSGKKFKKCCLDASAA